jgi:hypothetical protein
MTGLGSGVEANVSVGDDITVNVAVEVGVKVGDEVVVDVADGVGVSVGVGMAVTVEVGVGSSVSSDVALAANIVSTASCVFNGDVSATSVLLTGDGRSFLISGRAIRTMRIMIAIVNVITSERFGCWGRTIPPIQSTNVPRTAPARMARIMVSTSIIIVSKLNIDPNYGTQLRCGREQKQV